MIFSKSNYILQKVIRFILIQVNFVLDFLTFDVTDSS